MKPKEEHGKIKVNIPILICTTADKDGAPEIVSEGKKGKASLAHPPLDSVSTETKHIEFSKASRATFHNRVSEEVPRDFGLIRAGG
jgi:hypothetical protein